MRFVFVFLVMDRSYCVFLDSEPTPQDDFNYTPLWNYLLPNPTENIIFVHSTRALELVTDTRVRMMI